MKSAFAFIKIHLSPGSGRKSLLFPLLILLLATPVRAAESACEWALKTSSNEVRFLTHQKSRVPVTNIVTQCAGTCYLEASLAQAESGLSHYLGRQVGLSRGHLFASLLKKRAMAFLSQGSLAQFSWHLQDGLIDVVSVGTHSEILSIFAQSGTLMVSPKTTGEIESETRLMEKLHVEVGRKLYDYHQRGLLNGEASENLYSQAKKEIENLINPVLELQEQQGRLVHLQMDEAFAVAEHNYEAVEKMVLSELHKGRSVLVDYLHLKDHLQMIEGQSATLTLERPDEQLRLSHGSPNGGKHVALIIDYVLNDEGQVESYVVRNSWGQHQTRDGHFLMDVNYFKKAAAVIAVRVKHLI